MCAIKEKKTKNIFLFNLLIMIGFRHYETTVKLQKCNENFIFFIQNTL